MQVKEQVFSSASVDADICAGRCGHLRRSMRITIAIQKIPQQGTFTT
ncbi:hypothetical protein HMPREF0673_01769 [Leyella stercorea DSM 18206]|uniref:Uncharacterized protein n=1 Tax=Leyella stercorea DSM 18206 TaxID=1002367 RepID=G6AYQ9_9BACT|nr:hypothetical protein HMPREF0673_01769 [Leyella stercorea DSM 18206]